MVYQEIVEWFQHCLVAEATQILPITILEKELHMNAIKCEKLLSLGGARFLLKFGSEEALKKVVEEKAELLKHWFHEVKEWTGEEPPKSRTVWLSVLGLPFKAAGEENFKLLAEGLGKFLVMDDRNGKEVGMGRLRMSIETDRMERIMVELEVELDGRIYEVLVVEECFHNGCQFESTYFLNTTEESGESKPKQWRKEAVSKDSATQGTPLVAEQVQITSGRKDLTEHSRRQVSLKGGLSEKSDSWVCETPAAVDANREETRERKSEGKEEEWDDSGKSETIEDQEKWVRGQDGRGEQSQKSKFHERSVFWGVEKKQRKKNATEITKEERCKLRGEKTEDHLERRGSDDIVEETVSGQEDAEDDIWDEEPEDSWGKSQNIHKMRRRKIAKEKEIIKYVRRSKKNENRSGVQTTCGGRKWNINSNCVESAQSLSKAGEEESMKEAQKREEEKQKEESRRKEAELTYQFSSKIGVEFLGEPEEVVQFLLSI